jgi:hypothetical protein
LCRRNDSQNVSLVCRAACRTAARRVPHIKPLQLEGRGCVSAPRPPRCDTYGTTGHVSQRGQIKRRELIAFVGGAAAGPLAARAQQPDKIYRVGLLSTGGTLAPRTSVAKPSWKDCLLKALLRAAIWYSRSVAATGEMSDCLNRRPPSKASKVDALITFGYPAAAAAKVLAKDVPVVVIGSGDPVATGLAESLGGRGGGFWCAPMMLKHFVLGPRYARTNAAKRVLSLENWRLEI